MELKAGINVTKHVRLKRPLGEGAMGAVWVADHLTLKTEVAVKFISAALAADNAEIVARFEQEASVAAQIKSPHVVQTFDQGVMEGGTPYIVMELLEGESMGQRLERTGRLSLRQTAQVITQVARALSKAHELGIVHRDIKPDNIFLTTTDDGLFCKVLDFGIAKQTQLPKMGGLTNPGVMIGTPEYMSPEQVLSAKDVDYSADLWALAVTAYYALTGGMPFTADALGALCVALLKAEFPPPSTFRAELPPGIDEWFGKALHKEPDERFGAAREMALALVRLIPQRADLEDQLLHSYDGVTAEELRAATHVGLGRPKIPGEDDPLGDVADMYWEDEDENQPSTRRPVPDSERTPHVATSATLLTGTRSVARPVSRRLKWSLLGGGALAAATIIAVIAASAGGSDETSKDKRPRLGQRPAGAVVKPGEKFDPRRTLGSAHAAFNATTDDDELNEPPVPPTASAEVEAKADTPPPAADPPPAATPRPPPPPSIKTQPTKKKKKHYDHGF